MRTTLRFTTLAFLAALSVAACHRPVTSEEENTEPKERVIVYSVDASEVRQTLENEEEWNTLLDLFCDYAKEGMTVTFYNMSQPHISSGKGTGGAKSTIRFSTTSSEEMKAWMKEMEQQGRTVSVSYDSGTGRWNGVAYATNPANYTSNLILGSWKLEELVVGKIDSEGHLQDTSHYVYDHTMGSLCYTFFPNDTSMLVTTVADGSSFVEYAPWSLTAEGELHNTLLPNNGLWNVNWITSVTMIISQTASSYGKGNTYYQLQFERQ